MLSFPSIVLVFLLQTLAPSADSSVVPESETYVIKKGEVWDWQDVLAKSPNYRGHRGFGLSGVVKKLNGSPSLQPGNLVNLSPLRTLLTEAGMFQRYPHLGTLLEVRTFGEAKARIACSKGFLPSPKKTKAYGRRLAQKLQLLQESAPVAAQKRIGALRNQLKALAITPRTRGPLSALVCKDHLALLNKSGYALEAIVSANKISPN